MKKTRFSFVSIENMSTFAAQTKKQTLQSECSAVGSALRSGRRGRAFESPHSDRERQAVKIACRFLPSQTAVKAQLIWLSLKTWLLY